MPDLRKDPIVGRWVIVAKSRAKRPHDFDCHAAGEQRQVLPLLRRQRRQDAGRGPGLSQAGLAGQSRRLARARRARTSFPALEIEGDLHKRGEGIYDMMRGVGAHEVIIESPQHLLSTADLSEDNLRDVFWVYRDRLVDLKKDRRLVYGMIFKNVGEAAGASLEHTHSQLIVTPIVPISVYEEMTGCQEFYKYRGRCVFCDMIQQELAVEKRIVVDTPGFVAFCPFASRFPFETWILPKAHSSHYENIQKNGVEDLARMMKQVMGKIEAALDRPAYNYIVHTAPFDTPRAESLSLAY